MKWMVIAAMIGSLSTCDGASGSSTPNAPTPPPSNADIAGSSIAGTLSGTLQDASGTSCNAANHQLQTAKR